MQVGYLLGRKGSVASHVYVEFEAEDVDLTKLQQCVNHLVQRHGMLRAVINSDGTQQIMHRVPEYQIKIKDDFASATEQNAYLETRRSNAHKPPYRYNVEAFPLWCIEGTKLDNHAVRFHIDLDLATLDIHSHHIILSELAQLYSNLDATLPPVNLMSFAQYIQSSSIVDTAKEEQNLAYWQSRLHLIPKPPLFPSCWGRLQTEVDMHRYDGILEQQQWNQLKERALEAEVSVSILVLTAFCKVISVYSDTPDFTLNMIADKRTEATMDIVGEFLQVLACNDGYNRYNS